MRAGVRVILLGNSGSGKSTALGQLLYLRKRVSEAELGSLKRSCQNMGQPYAYWAWIVDEVQVDRKRELTVLGNYRSLSTVCNDVWIMDPPGHRFFTGPAIRQTANATYALVFISADDTEFEQAFIPSGSLIQHIRALNFLEVSPVYIMNKMDLKGYSQAAFNKAVAKLTAILHSLNINTPPKVIPISAFLGDNVNSKPETNMPWYFGPNLYEVIQSLSPVPIPPFLPPTSTPQPLNLSLTFVKNRPRFNFFQLRNPLAVCTVLSGEVVKDMVVKMPFVRMVNTVKSGKRVKGKKGSAPTTVAGEGAKAFCKAPSNDQKDTFPLRQFEIRTVEVQICSIKGIEGLDILKASTGNICTVGVENLEDGKGLFKRFKLNRGTILTNGNISFAHIVVVEIAIVDIGFEVRVGYSADWNVYCAHTGGVITSIDSVLDPHTGKAVDPKPATLKAGSLAQITVAFSHPIPADTHQANPMFGKIIVRDRMQTVGMGHIKQIIKKVETKK